MLVGGCSAAITVAAHTAANGATPRGGALMLALLMCAVIGALGSGARGQGLPSVIGALGAAQLFGHLTLGVAGGAHHHAGALGLTPTMLASHAVATLLLGIAIAGAEHLYVVATSVLHWLRLIAVPALRVTPRPWRGSPDVAPVRPVHRCAGLGMRAPPAIWA